MSTITVEELASQLAELRHVVVSLQAMVKDQQDEISSLKRHVVRLEHEYSSPTGNNAVTTPNKLVSGLSEVSASPTYLGTCLCACSPAVQCFHGCRMQPLRVTCRQ